MTRAMKDSGIEWIGQIPEDWEVLRIKTGIKRILSGKWGSDPIKDDRKNLSIIRIADFNRFNLRVKSVSFTKRYINKYDDTFIIKPSCELLIEKSGGGEKTYVGQVVKYDGNDKAGFTNFISKLTINLDLFNLSFLNYVFSSLYSNGLVKKYITQTTGIQNLDVMNYLNELTVYPPLGEQERIASILDEKVDCIDAIIADTKQSIEELKQYKQSLITETVTKGLSKNVPMKDSGIEWIGQIPEDWKVVKLKNILKEVSIKNHPNDEVLSLYRDYGVVPKNSRNDNYNVTSFNTATYKYVEKNDVVINKMKAWQGSMAVSQYSGIVSPAYYTYKVITKINYKFLHYMLRNPAYIQEYKRISTGLRIGQWDLDKQQFNNLLYALPIIEIQNQIANFLDRKISEIDQLIKYKEQLIPQYEEYKKSMIYEYVTGKRNI